MSERKRIEQALTFDAGCEPSAQEIIDALNRAGFQITPQAGEATDAADMLELAVTVINDVQDAGDWDVDTCIAIREMLIQRAHRSSLLPRTAPPRPVGPTAGDILISRDAAMTVLARWVYDEHWMKASDDMLAVAVQPSPVAPVWQPIESAPRDGTEFLAVSIHNDQVSPITITLSYPCPEGMTWSGEVGWKERGKNWPSYPTHWTPLPSPPDSPGTTEES